MTRPNPSFRAGTVYTSVTVEDLEAMDGQAPVSELLPPLPPIPSHEGQQCALCGLPAQAVEVRPLEVQAQDDLLTNSVHLRAVQKYRFVCGGPHEEPS